MRVKSTLFNFPENINTFFYEKLLEICAQAANDKSMFFSRRINTNRLMRSLCEVLIELDSIHMNKLFLPDFHSV